MKEDHLKTQEYGTNKESAYQRENIRTERDRDLDNMKQRFTVCSFATGTNA